MNKTINNKIQIQERIKILNIKLKLKNKINNKYKMMKNKK